MLQSNEIVAFLISIGVIAFLLVNRKRHAWVASDRLLILAFLFYLASLSFNIIEDFSFVPEQMSAKCNLIEHLSKLVFAGLLTLWLYIVLYRRKGHA